MKNTKSLLISVLLVLSFCTVAGNSLNKAEMLAKLDFYDVSTRMSKKTFITPKQSKMLVSKPKSIFSMYIDLEHTSNIKVTAIEFDNEVQASKMDEKKVNGFHALNWFFLGNVDNKSKAEIVHTLER